MLKAHGEDFKGKKTLMDIDEDISEEDLTKAFDFEGIISILSFSKMLFCRIFWKKTNPERCSVYGVRDVRREMSRIPYL